METRKTTLDERVEIVKDCIEHDFNYNLIAKKYFVSYSQVRRWTLKYKENGIVG
ncbi:transposase, partial [Clostridioides difficile]